MTADLLESLLPMTIDYPVDANSIVTRMVVSLVRSDGRERDAEGVPSVIQFVYRRHDGSIVDVAQQAILLFPTEHENDPRASVFATAWARVTREWLTARVPGARTYTLRDGTVAFDRSTPDEFVGAADAHPLRDGALRTEEEFVHAVRQWLGESPDPDDDPEE